MNIDGKKPILIVTSEDRYLALKVGPTPWSLDLVSIHLDKDGPVSLDHHAFFDTDFVEVQGNRSATLARMEFFNEPTNLGIGRLEVTSYYPGDMSVYTIPVQAYPSEDLGPNFLYFQMAAQQALAVAFAHKEAPFVPGDKDSTLEDYWMTIGQFFYEWQEALEDEGSNVFHPWTW